MDQCGGEFGIFNKYLNMKKKKKNMGNFNHTTNKLGLIYRGKTALQNNGTQILSKS